MSFGFIDSASLMNATSALACHKSYEEWGEWEWRSITDITEALFIHHLLKIAPGPSPSKLENPYNELYAFYDLACKQLGTIIDVTPIDVTIKDSAKREFRNWLFNNVDYTREVITKTKQEKGYANWERWTIEHAWVDHSYRLNGLFNTEIIYELAFVLDVPLENMRNLWKKTTNLQQVKKWSEGRNLNKNFELARDAFIASAILRGRFHDFVVNKMQWQIMPHPIRQHIHEPISEGTAYKIPKAVEFLTQIVVNGAMEEKKTEDRIIRWTENIRKIQDNYFQNEIPEILNLELSQEEALDLAINTAKGLHIRVHSRSLEKYLELAIMLGVIFVTGSIGFWIVSPLVPLTAGAVGVGTWMKGVSKPLGRRAAEALRLTEGHLHELAMSKPGCIVRSRDDVKK